jgi:hypothetical protein
MRESIADAVDDVSARGLLNHDEVQSRLTHMPEWLAGFQRPTGFTQFEEQLGIVIPAAVKAFWREPALVCLLDAWGRDNYLLESPTVIVWKGMQSLSICSQGHSVSLAAVALDAHDDPPMYWGWTVGQEDETPAGIFASSFTEFVLRTVRNIEGDKLIRYLPRCCNISV